VFWVLGDGHLLWRVPEFWGLAVETYLRGLGGASALISSLWRGHTPGVPATSGEDTWTMGKRLRKKRHLGEFHEWSLPIAVQHTHPDGFDDFLEDFLEQAIEAQGLFSGEAVRATDSAAWSRWAIRASPSLTWESTCGMRTAG